MRFDSLLSTNVIRLQNDNINIQKQTIMQTLYDKLKPELKSELLNQEKTYSTSIRKIITTLKSTSYYSELKISEVSAIETFAGCEASFKWSAWDWKYGDKLFTNE